MTKFASELIKLIKSLQQKRYPVVLVLQWETHKLTAQDVDAVSVECSLRRINYREDVLEKSGGNIILGAYLRGHFTEWLLEQARTTKGLIVEEVDELIATWSEPDREAFFLEFLHTQCNDPSNSTKRIPIVLISRLASKHKLPMADRGQGAVFDPSRYK